MEQQILTQFKRLPEHLQQEVLHYIQFLLKKLNKTKAESTKSKNPTRPTFTDFHFPDKGQTYGRAEIYGEDGR